ncbi:unnamed protein product [Closterium sp. NIES-64]|nr:unnamed protein product [Closterium sp. NIES-64]
MATVRRIIPHTERGKATRHNYVNMYVEAGTLETGSDDEFMPTVLYSELQSPRNAATPGGSTLPNDGADAEEDDEPIPAHILNNDWSWLEFGDDGSEDGASADVEEVPQKVKAKTPPRSSDPVPLAAGPPRHKVDINHTPRSSFGPVVHAHDASMHEHAELPTLPPFPQFATKNAPSHRSESRQVKQESIPHTLPSLLSSSMASGAFCSPGRAPFTSPWSARASSSPSQVPANHTPARREEAAPARGSGVAGSADGEAPEGARVDSGSNNDASRVATLEAELRALMGKVAQLSGQVVKRQEEPEGQTGQNVEKPAVAVVESQPPVPAVTKPAATPSRKPQVAATVRADRESPDNPASKGTSGVRKDRQRLSDMKDAPHLPPNPLMQDDLGSGGSHGMGRTDEPILDRQGNTHGKNMSSQHYEEGPWRFGGKRGRGDESVIIVVDYDPEERVPGLPRSMPKPKPFRVSHRLLRINPNSAHICELGE